MFSVNYQAEMIQSLISFSLNRSLSRNELVELGTQQVFTES